MKVRDQKYKEVFLEEKKLGDVKSQRYDKKDKEYKIVLQKKFETKVLRLKK